MKKADMEMSPDNIFSPKGQELRVDKTSHRDETARYIKGRLGLVVDGTGKDPEKIANQHERSRN